LKIIADRIQYTPDDVTDVLLLKNHKKSSCRTLDFSKDGLCFWIWINNIL